MSKVDMEELERKRKKLGYVFVGITAFLLILTLTYWNKAKFSGEWTIEELRQAERVVSTHYYYGNLAMTFGVLALVSLVISFIILKSRAVPAHRKLR